MDPPKRAKYGTMKWTSDELFDLFTSSPTGPIRDPGKGYEDLLTFLNCGWIVAEKCPYEPTAEPEITDPPSGERLTFEAAFKRGLGGRAHGMLK